MTDDEKAAYLKHQWGLSPQPPPELLVATKLKTLQQYIATSFEAVSAAGGFALLLGESGRPLLTELDRYKRQMKWLIEDLTP